MNETKNAVIRKAYFDTERGLSAWLDLDYGGLCQGFGGYLLYAPDDWGRPGEKRKRQANYAGHFIYRCLEVAEVDEWAKLAGKTIRVRTNGNGTVESIGHIIKDVWFEPRTEFQAMERAVNEEGL